jgi:putative PEP-CTERM system TPR-repeat lipoprotein
MPPMTFCPNRKPALHVVTRALLGFGLAAALTSGPSLAAVESKAGQYYEDALSRYNKNDLPGAVIQLKNALQIDKAMLSAQLLLGKALMASGEVAAAEVAFTEALRLGVNRSEVVLPLARALIDQGKHKSLFDRPELSPVDLPPNAQLKLHLLRAWAYSDLGNPREAIRSVEAARSIDSRSADVWAAEVPLRIRSRQPREALAAANRALELAPDSAEVWNQKAAILHANGDRAGALTAYDKTLQLVPGHVDARVARAGLLMDMQRFKEAADDVNLIRGSSPLDPRAAYMRALLADREGDSDAAKESLKEVTELIDPVPIEFIRYRPQVVLLNGLAHFALGEMEKAKVYLEALAIHESLPAAKVLAQIYLFERSPSKAQQVLENYLRSFPKDSRALMLLASTHLSLGRNSRATTLMQEALALEDTPEARASLGQSLLQGGNSDAATVQLEKAFLKEPGQPSAGFMLVGVYLRGGQLRKAVSVAEAVVKSSPNNPTHHNLVGIAKGAAGDVVGARAAFENALKLDPKLAPAKLNLAKLDIEAKDYPKAEQRLRQMISDNERNIDAYITLAVLADRRGQYDEMRRALEKARDMEGPKRVAAALKLVDHYMRQRNPTAALEAAKLAFSKLPEDFNVLIMYARARLAKSDIAGARLTLKDASRVAEYDADRQLATALVQLGANDALGAQYSLEKGLSARPGYLPALALMTDVELRQGDPVKAERRARAIVETNPKLAVGHSLLGDIAAFKGQGPIAIEAYRKAHQVEPSSATLLRLFNAMARQGDNRNALALAEQWLATHPDDYDVRRGVADGYARAENFPAAKQAYLGLLGSRPKDGAVLNNLANVQLRMNDLAAAVTTAGKAVALDPGSPSFIDTLGWSLFLAGQHDRALSYLRDARIRDPENLTIRYHLGAALAKAGRKSEALLELEVATTRGQKFDGLEEAKKLLATIR